MLERMMVLDSKGQTRVSALIYLLAAILVVYVAIKVVPPYMHYYAMDDEVHQQLKMSKINDADTIRGDLLEKARELGLRVDPGDLELTYDKRERLSIRLHWEEEVDFEYGIVKVFPFEIDTSAAGYQNE